MKIKDILQNYVNEDGVINFDDLDFDNLDDLVNNEIGKIVSKTRKSERAKQEVKINENKQISDTLEKTNNELETKVDQMMNAFNQLMNQQQELVSRDKERELRDLAKENKINEKVIDMLKGAGADLSKVDISDLEDFKMPDIEIGSTPKLEEEAEENKVDRENEKHLKEMILQKVNRKGFTF